MSTIYKELTDRVISFVESTFPTVPIGKPNLPLGRYTKPDNALWLSLSILPVDPVAVGIGAGGTSQYGAIVQLDINYPVDEAHDQLFVSADQWVTAFYEGLILSSVSYKIRAGAASLSPLQYESGYAKLSVSTGASIFSGRT